MEISYFMNVNISNLNALIKALEKTKSTSFISKAVGLEHKVEWTEPKPYKNDMTFRVNITVSRPFLIFRIGKFYSDFGGK